MKGIQIISTKHILVAVFKALREVVGGSDGRPGGLRTRNIHSEIVFSLSPNNNVCPPPTPIGGGEGAYPFGGRSQSHSLASG